MRGVAAAILLLASTAVMAAAAASRRSEIVEVVEKVSPAVVNISAEQIVRRSAMWDEFFFGLDRPRRERAQSLGSGAIIDPRGIILTNDHVISGAARIVATTKTGVELECEVVGSDADNDLAVLRVKNSRGALPALQLGTSSDLLIGETILAIGNPFGFSNTVTSGVVSAVGRSVRGQNNQRSYTDFIQIDAPINPGNSGGPVVNIQGELIGIATAIVGGAQGIGFAIPVDRARRIVQDLLQYGEVRAAWIGVRGRTIGGADERTSRGRGLRIRSVFPDSPAARAGLRPGDVVVSVDGVPVDSEDAFETALSTRGPGRPMKLVLRSQNAAGRTVTLQAQSPPPGLGIRILREDIGISLRRVSGELRISVVDASSLAARKGLRSGDLLLGINGTAVKELDDVDRVLQRDHNRSTVLMEVGRGRFAYVLTFPLD